MSVPAEIRAVKRPVNTIVVDLGCNSLKRFAVRARKGIKYIKGGNPQPVSGQVVGHIINGVFVPKQKQIKTAIPDFLSWGAAALVHKLSEDIYRDLLNVMDCKDALMTFVLAALRVIYPGVPNSRLRSRYEKSFLSVYYPSASLSENTISKHLQALGANQTVRENFCLERLKGVSSQHHIAIDGTLIQDTSTVNDLSGFSYKARIKGCKELSVLYAYDLEKGEPVCAQVFPGNQPDVSTCREFIVANHIEQGILVADKGFNLKEIRKLHGLHPQLHYLIALKRDDKRLKDNNLLRMNQFVGGQLSPIFCSKCKISDNTWVYAFRDSTRASLEEKTYVAQQQKAGSFNPDEFDQKRQTFGLLAFESDLDLSFETVYSTYKDRWVLELIFKQYKTGLDANETRVQNDYAVIGSEFINFIATIITARIVKAEKDAGLLAKHSYGEILEDLRQAWRLTDAPKEATAEDDFWIHTTLETKSYLAKLGLIKITEQQEPRKRGRPRKNPLVENKEKRPRGRPRIHPIGEPGSKRKPGRPKKVVPVFVGPKRPRGRPKKV